MGIISLKQEDSLFWLGRYSERVYTTIRLYFRRCDTMIDQNVKGYEEFCRNLDIPNIYSSPEDFRMTYAFSKEDPNSIYSNLLRAYDNAIELRETIGSETLSYIQLAVYEIEKAKESHVPLVDLQNVKDDILAFWGIADDIIENENCRNIIKIGKRVERIDLYGRLHLPKEKLAREIRRLAGRIDRCSIDYKAENLEELKHQLDEEELDYYKIVQTVESLID